MFTAQVDVNGKNAAPVWTWLKEQEGGLLGSGIKWNFTKFVVDGEGKAVARIGPMSDPIPAVQTEVEKLIGKPGQWLKRLLGNICRNAKMTESEKSCWVSQSLDAS